MSEAPTGGVQDPLERECPPGVIASGHGGGVGVRTPWGWPRLSVTPCRSPPQRSRSACGSAAAAWRSSPAAAWDTCSGSSTPTPSPAAVAPSLPGKWPRGRAGPRAPLPALHTGLTVGCVETCPPRGRRSAVTRAAVGTEDSGLLPSDRCWSQQVPWGTRSRAGQPQRHTAVLMESKPGWPGVRVGQQDGVGPVGLVTEPCAENMLRGDRKEGRLDFLSYMLPFKVQHMNNATCAENMLRGDRKEGRLDFLRYMLPFKVQHMNNAKGSHTKAQDSLCYRGR